MSFLFLVTVCVITMHGYSFAIETTPNTTMKGNSPGCSKLVNSTTETLTGYLGWPIVISFENVALDVVHDIFFDVEGSIKLSDFENKTALCILRLESTGEIQYNTSFIFHENTRFEDAEDAVYRLPSISEDTPTAYDLEFTLGDRCGHQKLIIQKSNAPEVTSNCSNALHSQPFKAINGDYFELTCGGTRDFNFLSKTTNLTYKWIYNCGNKVEQNFQRRGNRLVSEEAAFLFAGQYLCIIEYRGQQIPAMKYDVCVRHESILYPKVEPKCTVPKARVGHNVTIRCNATVGETKAKTISTSVEWRKNGVKLCKEPEWNPPVSRFLCSKESSLESIPCYDTIHVPEVQLDEYTINLTIQNVNVSDFGQYQLLFKWGPGQRRTQINITLEEDIAPILNTQIAGISIGVTFLLLAIVFLLICLWRKNDVLWLLKKHFGPYEKEPHSYAAYFVYYYDSTDKASDEMTTMKKLVEGLHDFMNKFGGTVYDEQRDPNIVAGDADNVKLVAGDCHRIIVMLSPGFVKDKWSRYKSNTALTEAVESGRKMIFITIPGTKDAIQNMSDEPRKTLQSAIKRNVTVEWNGKIPFNGSFRRRMEYGLPKLQKPDYSRYLSDSSELQLTYQNMQTKGNDSKPSTPRQNGFDFVV